MGGKLVGNGREIGGKREGGMGMRWNIRGHTFILWLHVLTQHYPLILAVIKVLIFLIYIRSVKDVGVV